MRINKSERGITLIALVVTIIVLLILAGVSISMLTGQNGILNRASEAKTKTEVSGEKEKIDLAAMEALTDGYGKITKDSLKKALKSQLGKDVELTGNGPWQYLGDEGAYTITEDGKTAKGWIYLYDANGMPEKVTNGQGTTLTIGDYINYDPADYDGYDETKNGFYNSPAGTVQETTYTESSGVWKCAEASDYQELLDKGQVATGNGHSSQTYKVSNANGIKWRVLGADETTGELLIVSGDVLKENNATKKMIFRGITGYLFGIDELNKVCNIYGRGTGATGARSITLDDVNKAVGKARGKNTSKWTYSWTENSLINKAPSYDGGTNYTNYSHVKDGSTTGLFNYYDEATKKWKTNKKELTGFTGTEEITTIYPDYVSFDMRNNENYVENIATNGYKVLFKDDMTEEDKYWLGSSFCYASADCAHWGIYYVFTTGWVDGYDGYNSCGLIYAPSFGIRPVVTLRSDIQLQSTSIENGITTYNIKD